jgi:hypothetical protein
VLVLVGCVVVSFAFGQFMRAAIRDLANSTTVQATTNQQFTVTGTPSIRVDNSDGSVVVHGGPAGAVTVDATISASGSSAAAAQRDLKNITVSATQSGNTISIQTSLSGSSSPFHPRTVDLVITVPATSNISVTLLAGNVDVSGVTGAVNATLEAGNFNAQGLTLQDNSQIEVVFGSLLLDGTLAPGASADVTVQRGEATFTLPAATATHLSATADAGSISIAGWNIPVQQQGSGATASGDLGTGGTGALTIHVASGSIVISARQ